jgi:hypothetical protein
MVVSCLAEILVTRFCEAVSRLRNSIAVQAERPVSTVAAALRLSKESNRKSPLVPLEDTDQN